MNLVKKASASDTRAKVVALEQQMLEGQYGELLELPVQHYFSQGVYGREMFIPAGTLVTGKIHKYTQLNVLLCGELSVMTEDGVKRVKPPFVVVSPPGTKRVAYAHEDTRWLTIHGTDKTNVDEIEDEFIAQSEQDYLMFVQEKEKVNLCLGQRWHRLVERLLGIISGVKARNKLALPRPPTPPG